MVELHLQSFTVFGKSPLSVHFAALPLSGIVVSKRECESASAVLLALLPSAWIWGAVVVVHYALAVTVVIAPLSTVTIPISIFVCTKTVLFVTLPPSFIPFPIRVDIRSISLFFIVSPLSRIPVFIVNYQLPITLLPAVPPVALVYSFFLSVNIATLTVLLAVQPFPLVNIAICVVISSSAVLQVPVPIPLVTVAVRIVVCSMAFPKVVLPLSVIFCLVDILELPHSVLFILFPLPVIWTAVEVSGFASTLATAVSLLAHINRPVGKSYFGYLGRKGVELRFKDTALGEVIASMASFFVFEVHSLEIISILVFVFPASVLQPVFEATLKEKFSVAVQFSKALKNWISPFTLIFEIFVEHKDTEPTSHSTLKVTLIIVAIAVVCSALSVGFAEFPTAHIFCQIILFLGFVNKMPLSVEGSL